MTTGTKKERMMSLDVLRGLDMLYLVAACTFVRPLLALFGIGPEDGIYKFLTKHPWEGFSAYDLIQPLFIFMCGAAIPFALGKRMDADGRPAKGFWRHVWSRVAVLWMLGMIARGNLLAFDLSSLSVFNETLQMIATGYLVAAAVMCIRRKWMRYAITAVLPVCYGAAMAAWGDYGKATNLAVVIDQHIVALIYPKGSALANTAEAWFALVPMNGFMALCGFHATNVIRSGDAPWRKVWLVCGIGLALYAAGFAAERCGIPCIKDVFTLSFVFQAMGISLLLMGTLYAIIDVCKCRRGLWLAVLFGQTSLAAYMFGIVFKPIAVFAAEKLASGLAAGFPEIMRPFIIGVVAFAIISWSLFVWRRFRQVHDRAVVPVDGGNG